MFYKQIINKSYRILQRDKIIFSISKENFLIREICNRIFNSIESINIEFNYCLEIGSRNNILKNNILKNNKNIKYLQADISHKLLKYLNFNSNKICFDEDIWAIRKNSFDLIISNFYLHWSNNIENVMHNILNTLKKNGFFLCTLPGPNTMIELKKSMLNADIECYGGSYQRFLNLYSIQDIGNLLYKIGFHTPLAEIDNLTFKYKNFKDLLKDIKLLFETNVLNDRNNFFEKKDYFNKVEKYYWENFSIKNKLPLTYQIIYLSGWKNNKK